MASCKQPVQVMSPQGSLRGINDGVEEAADDDVIDDGDEEDGDIGDNGDDGCSSPMVGVAVVVVEPG